MHDDYAIVLVSGKRVEFYLHNINQTKLIKHLDIELPNQHKTGGQSAQRFERIRNEIIKANAVKICELMVQFYVTSGSFKCRGLVVAGPAEMKELVCREDLFVKYFSKVLSRIVTITEITSESIYRVIQLTCDIFSNKTAESDSIRHFEQSLSNPTEIDLFVFGEADVITNFNAGQLREIFVSDKNKHFEYIIKTNVKTKICIVTSNKFVSQYGEIVGIRYFSTNYDYDCDHDCMSDNEIVEV